MSCYVEARAVLLHWSNDPLLHRVVEWKFQLMYLGKLWAVRERSKIIVMWRLGLFCSKDPTILRSITPSVQKKQQ